MFDLYDNDFEKAFDEAVDAIEKKEHRLIWADELIKLIDDDIASLDMPREGYDVCLCTLRMVTQYIKALPTVEAIPLEWIEKQKARCYPRSISWLALEALLKTWKEEKDEMEDDKENT